MKFKWLKHVSVVPLVAKPRVVALKNKWTPGKRKKASFGREITFLALSIAAMLFIYFGTLRFLRETFPLVAKQAFPLSVFINPFLFIFFVAIFLTCAVRALGTLFLARDVEFLLSAPISQSRFFVGKFFDILLHSVWTFVVFGLPLIVAVDSYFAKSLSFAAWSIIVILPLFLCAAALATCVMVLFASIVPANRTRDVLIGAGCIFGIVLLLKTASYNLQTVRLLLSQLKFVSRYTLEMGPPHWATHCLMSYIYPSQNGAGHYLLFLYLAAIFSFILAFAITSSLHFYAYSKALSPDARLRIESRNAQKRLVFLTPLMTQRLRAIFSKELRLFARDMTQTLQLIMLLSICIIYIYNFRVLSNLKEIPDAYRYAWQAFLFLANIATASLLVSAVCTRFVFPSVSLEGASYWVIQSAPMTLREFLRAKFLVWFIPIGGIGSVISLAGAMALDLSPSFVILVGLSSWMISYGLIACSIGLGGVFADFDWDYSAQVSATFGSVINMLSCMIISGLSLIPFLIIMLVKAVRDFAVELSVIQWGTCILLSLVLLSFMHIAIGRWMMHLGEGALERKM